MLRTMLAGILVFLAAGAASAQDMLSQILIDGEGWRVAAEGYKTIYHVAADARGAVSVLHAGGLDRIEPGGEVKVIDRESRTQPTLPPMQTTRAGISYGADRMQKVLVVHRPDLPRDARPEMRKLDGIACPSGVTLWPDRGTLVVGDAEGKHLWAFRVEEDGSLAHGDRYYALRVPRGETASGVTALTVDAAGRLYACTPLGVQVFDPTGRLSGVLTKPADGELTAIAFGGPEADTLFVACGGKIFARKTKAKGVTP
jgi:gluconolactonase